MTTERNTVALTDEALDMVAGGGFFGDVGHVIKTGVQEVGHYAGVVVGAVGDMTVGGGSDPFYKMVPRMVDGITGRK